MKFIAIFVLASIIFASPVFETKADVEARYLLVIQKDLLLSKRK
jgi:hypothetical protein